ncbi:MAG: tryptophan synthase subunit alpha [Bdellovibrionales bacterium]|nr:tryptophan synthase subunit alpha [Bdellovibrionales bacterium]
MKKRLEQTFHDISRRPLFSVFYTAGYPTLDSTVSIGTALAEAGVDFLEVGIPFSDPIADGPVIQESSNVALANGMRVERLLEDVAALRKSVDIPIFVMGYLNPVLQYGVEKFLDALHAADIDGVILPDLPVVDFEKRYRKLFEDRELQNVFLVTPQTSDERVRFLDGLSSGFLYAVSTASITGSALEVSAHRDAYLKRLRSLQLRNPLIVGFGIRNYESYASVSEHTAGAIVGSAFLQFLGAAVAEGRGRSAEEISSFVSSIRFGKGHT